MGRKTAGKFYTDVDTAITIGDLSPVLFISNTVSGAIKLVDSTSIELKASGLYQIEFNATVVATDKCVQTLYLVDGNGNPIAGAKASQDANKNDYVNLAFNTLLTVDSNCGCDCSCDVTYATLQVIAEVETSIEVANLIITKIA